MMLLWPFLRRFFVHRRMLLAGYLCIPLSMLADVWITLQVGDAIDRLRQSQNTDFLTGLFWILLGLGLVRGVFRFLQRLLIVGASRHVETRLKQDLFDKLTSLSFSFHNRNLSGDIVSRMTSDVENLRMFLGPGFMYVGGTVVLVPVSMVLLWNIHWQLACAMLLPLALMAVAMKVFTPGLHKVSMAVQESLAQIAHRSQENFSGVRVVKGYNREDSQGKRFESASRENHDNQVRLAHLRGMMHAASYGANDMTFVVILVIGGLALLHGQMSPGDVFKFIDLTLKVFWPVIALGWIAGMYPRAVASARRVQELLDEEPEIADPAEPQTLDEVRGELELSNVSYTYPGAPRAALTKIDVHVPAGTTLGVVGPTGSGKTTLLHLLGRLLEPAGKLTLDSVDIKDLALSTLRGGLGYVPQEAFLFSEPYRDNIAFGADEPLTDEGLAHLIQRAAMDEEVAAFPDGVDQLIGERGVTLSGGQRQRTCIARALAKDPPVLILDDCLSAVDTETEVRLLKHLREAGEGRTVVVAAHRLSSVMNADQILVLDDKGRVADRGTHEELTLRPGWYRETWDRQQLREELKEL
jgi:ATP-binding cassette subfamily B protein